MNNNLNILSVSSKFSICGLPIRADSYSYCTFGCEYCFSEKRVIMGDDNLKIGDVEKLSNYINRIDSGKFNSNNFLDMLVKDKYTWHLGGMSDALQPCEKKYGVTKEIIKISKKRNQPILISTKSSELYGIEFDNRIHAFQFSISNVNNNKIERFVPEISERIKLYKYLKSKGFKVSIRIQPFIPEITTAEIIDIFKDADHITIEGLKLIPQNKELINKILGITNLKLSYFENVGLYNLKRNVREFYYKDLIDRIKYYGLSYSIADNDWHNESTDKCCCGDKVSFKTTDFNDTALYKKYGVNYKLNDIKNEIPNCLKNCNVKSLFASNRQEGFKTVNEFFDIKFNSVSSPCSNIKNKLHEAEKAQTTLF